MKEDALRQICQAYADRGQNIEAGWIEYCTNFAPPGLNEQEFANARVLFFSGANCMWEMIIRFSEEAYKLEEERGKQILSEIYSELLQHKRELALHGPTVGNA